MHYFEYKDNRLFAEDVDLGELAAQAGTPLYVYSQATLTRHFQCFDQAFQGIDHQVCFAMKANSNLAVLALFASMGGGADIITGGELFRAMQAGIDPSKIVYSGVGKAPEEMRAALKAGICMFNLESIQEMEALNQVAGDLGLKAPVSFRVNPDVDAKTHPKITTGLAKNKFGMDMETAFAQYRSAQQLPHLEIKGISCHIGSQLTRVDPFCDALDRVSALVERLRSVGIELSLLDMGGGLGITYNDEAPPAPEQYAAALKDMVARLGLRIILEPGRVIVGNAGILLTKVLYTKATPVKNFVVVDAAMNDLVRPTMYDAFHAIWPVRRRQGATGITADVVGTICETGDFIARDREMPEFRQGDLMAVMSAGAYGFTMSSQYNSRPRAAEVMVNEDRWAVVRARESFEDLTRGEALPDWMGWH